MSELTDQITPFSGFENSVMTMPNILPVQQTKTNYTTAVSVQERRSISRVTANVLQEAELAGTSFYYRWTITLKDGSKRTVQGPSIDLAMCLVRNYGNCVIDVSVNEDATHYIFKGTLIDLESGFTCPRLFRQRKSQAIGSRFDRDRQEDLVFQIGQSKAIRNAVIKAMPSWLINQAIEKAHESEIRNIKPENIATARAKCINFFATYGVDVPNLEEKIGNSCDNWTQNNIVELREIATALKEGHVSIHVLFPDLGKPPKKTEDVDSKSAENIKEEKPVSAKNDDKQEDKKDPWDQASWINLKSTGLKSHAELYGETFSFQPIEIREAFKKKWNKCTDVGEYPFDENGNVLLTESTVDLWANFQLWLEESYPQAEFHMMRNYMVSFCTKAGIPTDYLANQMLENPAKAAEVLKGYTDWLNRQNLS